MGRKDFLHFAEARDACEGLNFATPFMRPLDDNFPISFCADEANRGDVVSRLVNDATLNIGEVLDIFCAGFFFTESIFEDSEAAGVFSAGSDR